MRVVSYRVNTKVRIILHCSQMGVFRRNSHQENLTKKFSEIKPKFSLRLIAHHNIKTHKSVQIWLHAFLTSALPGGE
jgi:hypothetical protein